MIEIEVQNETHQSQDRVRFAAVPRIGEGIRLREPDGLWASYDVIDVWYQKAEYGDIWMPYIHIRLTPPEVEEEENAGGLGYFEDDFPHEEEIGDEGAFGSLVGEPEPCNI